MSSKVILARGCFGKKVLMSAVILMCAFGLSSKSFAEKFGKFDVQNDETVCVATKAPEINVVIKQAPLEYNFEKSTQELAFMSRKLTNQFYFDNPQRSLGYYSPFMNIQTNVQQDVIARNGVVSSDQCSFYKRIDVYITLEPRIFVSNVVTPRNEFCRAEIKSHMLGHHKGVLEGVKRVESFYKQELQALVAENQVFYPVPTVSKIPQAHIQLKKDVDSIVGHGLEKMGMFINHHSDNFVHAAHTGSAQCRTNK